MNTTETNDVRSYLDWALKGRSAWWLYIIGAFLLYLVLILGRMLFGALLIPVFGSLANSSPAGQFFVQHLDFLVILISPLLLAWVLHNRPWWSVMMPRLKVEWRNLGMGFLFALFMLFISAIIEVVFYGIKITVEPQDLSIYLPFLVTTFFMFLLQTSAEELAFRGYYMQAVRRFTSSPMLIIGLTGAWFAFFHRLNLAGYGYPWYGILLWFFDGCMLAWLAYRSRSLWMPIGWHWANNFGLISLLSVKDSKDVVQGISFLVADNTPPVELLILNKIIIFLPLAFAIHWLLKRQEKTNKE